MILLAMLLLDVAFLSVVITVFSERRRRHAVKQLVPAPPPRPSSPPAKVWWTPRKRLPPAPAQTSAPPQVALREVVIPREDGLGHRVMHYPVSAGQLEREKLLFLLFGANGVFAAIEQLTRAKPEQGFKN